MQALPAGPIRLPAALSAPLLRLLGPRGAAAAARLLGLDALNDLYRRVSPRPTAASLCEGVLAELRVGYHVERDDLARVPRSGPLLVVANHPFGMLDGLVLLAALRRVRGDVKLLANESLAALPELASSAIFVDPFAEPGSAARNSGGLRAALRWLRGGGAILAFPAGEVAHLRLAERCVTDPPWLNGAAALLRRSGATALPIFIEGRNSALFQLAGLIHPRLRTALLAHELFNKRDSQVTLRIGRPAAPRRLATFEDDDSLTAYLRVRTYILRERATAADVAAHARRRAALGAAPIAPPVPRERLAREIAALPAGRRVLSAPPCEVYCVRAADAPGVLHEIGRLREETFRPIGEGTGRALDLDRFDEHYHHLFVWRADERRIIGAYRLGATDELLPRFGAAGLYTSTLFDFRPTLLARLNPALELGRSFIVSDQQRSYAALLLLWKGIGRFVSAAPRYRMLFGPVSISSEYQSLSRHLLMAFLRLTRFADELVPLVRPRNPPRAGHFRQLGERPVSTVVHDLDEVDELVREIETRGRSLPVLLRQYLKLNARLLGFNIDPDFGDVLDGLVLVDLLRTPPRVLERYLGAEEAAALRRHHGEAASPPEGVPH